MAPIRPSASMQVAIEVQAAVDENCPTELASQCHYEAYCHGDEQGLCVVTEDGRQVCFAQERGSSRVVVYWGRIGHFQTMGNVPGGVTSEQARTFRKPQQAAEFVIQALQADPPVEDAGGP